jgi:hypothetical protein
MIGKVYIIINKKNNLKYVGSTTTELNVRWSHHKSDFLSGKGDTRSLHQAYAEYGFDNFMIMELGSYEVLDGNHLRQCYEQLWINKFGIKNLLNDSNTFIPNKDHAKVRNKLKYEENKEDVLLSMKEKYATDEQFRQRKIDYAFTYREEHVDDCKKVASERHIKNKDKDNERSKQAYRDNPEKYKQYQKEYTSLAENREKIKARKKRVVECGCGKTYKHASASSHKRSKKHIDWEAKISDSK